MPLASDSFNSRILRRAWARYAVAFLATGTALLARWGLNPWLGDRLPFITLFPVIAFSALYCGIGPSVVTTVLAVAATKYWFIPPTHSFGQISPTQALDMTVFLLAFGLIIVVAEAHRGSAETLRRAQEELEDRVRQRTIELDTANRNLRDLTARLLQLQDEERRRFARELHDSVGQTLVALNMNLATVAAEIERLSKTGSVIKDSAALVEDLTKEVRTMSHLLHPPLLDEAGLNSALRWYIDGLVERSHIKVDLEYSQDLGRLSRELETAIFRTVQECLTNIHRHSQSPTAKVRVLRRVAWCAWKSRIKAKASRRRSRNSWRRRARLESVSEA